jgi:hypothetical protein
MHWDGYTVCSVISGAIVVLATIAGQGLSAQDRLYGLMGGGFFSAYGVFVASQHSGTFLFPIWIFVIPVGAIIYLVASIVAPEKLVASNRQGAVTKAPRAVETRQAAQGPAPSRDSGRQHVQCPACNALNYTNSGDVPCYACGTALQQS